MIENLLTLTAMAAMNAGVGVWLHKKRRRPGTTT